MSQATTEPLRAAITALLGEPVATADMVGDLDDRRLKALARLLHFRIAMLPDRGAAARCLAALDSLSEVEAGQLLRDPRLCLVLRLGATPGELVALLETAPAEADESALACGLPLDHSLPPGFDHPSAGLRRPRILNAAETKAALARLDRAVEIIEADDPLGRGVLTRLAANLVLRADDDRPKECWGATSGLAIGRIVIVNPNAVESDAHLAEALLHEAVHVAIDCAELDRPLFRNDARADAPAIPSPWTGAPLAPHAFVHATVVWAALLVFWTRHLKRTTALDSTSARYRWIRAGFDRFDPAVLGTIRDGLSPAAPTVARVARDAALGSVR